MTPLGRTDLDVFGLCLGGNVFGWTADEQQAHEVLDAYVAAGGNFIDTANSYLVEHGRSETIIGRWLAERGSRDDVVVATKVGGGSARCATCAQILPAATLELTPAEVERLSSVTQAA